MKILMSLKSISEAVIFFTSVINVRFSPLAVDLLESRHQEMMMIRST